MTTTIVRRRKLGKTSTDAITRFSRTDITAVRNDERLPPSNLYIRWGCTSTVPSRNILNKTEAIHLVGNKKAFRRILNRENLCPKTWFDLRSFETALDKTYPVIVRPPVHAQGRQVLHCNNIQQVRNAWTRVGGDGYISIFVPKVAEYRVFCGSGRVICVARKTPANPQDIAWNVARGGRFDNVRWDEWPLRAVKTSLAAYELSGLDFGGVDVMVDAAGECTILEINSAPSLTSEYRQQCFAKYFDYVVQNGKDFIPRIKQPGGYRKFIHPAIHTEAQR